MTRPLVSLATLFTAVLQGCPFGCPPATVDTEIFTLTDAEIEEIEANFSDTGAAFDGCLDVCQAIVGLQNSPDCDVTDNGDGTKTFTCTGMDICIGGRLHEVVTSRGRSEGPTRTATWLAQAAHDEAASVAAFLALAAELRHHHAPRDLVFDVLRAARDEVGHARTMRQLALARGARAVRPTTQALPPRELEAIACENAAEALVIETWNALVAWHQARHAADPELRAAMRTVAQDETRHAELARRLDAWLRSQLPAEARGRVEEARRAAVAALRERLRVAEADEELGLPDAETALRWVDGLVAQGLWG